MLYTVGPSGGFSSCSVLNLVSQPRPLRCYTPDPMVFLISCPSFCPMCLDPAMLFLTNFSTVTDHTTASGAQPLPGACLYTYRYMHMYISTHGYIYTHENSHMHRHRTQAFSHIYIHTYTCRLVSLFHLGPRMGNFIPCQIPLFQCFCPLILANVSNGIIKCHWHDAFLCVF